MRLDLNLFLNLSNKCKIEGQGRFSVSSVSCSSPSFEKLVIFPVSELFPFMSQKAIKIQMNNKETKSIFQFS